MKAVILFAILLLVACQPCPDCVCPAGEECPPPDCPRAEDCPECTCPDCAELDYNECPTITITKNVTIIKYACENGLTVDHPEDCFPDLGTDLVAMDGNESSDLIELVKVEPACIYGENGGLVSFVLGAFATNITIQVRDADEHEDIFEIRNLYEGNRHFVIGNEVGQADFNIRQGRVYMMRLKFFFKAHNKTLYSDERLVDTRFGSEYSTKKC
jgi:hypothetical protein